MNLIGQPIANQNLRRYGWFFRCLLGIGLTLAAVGIQAAPQPGLRLHFIDVGQADSILIQTPQGKNLLVDAGNNDDGQRVATYLRNQGVTQLHAVVGTHPHEDHIGGLDVIIRQFPVKKVFLPKATTTTKTFEDLLLAIKSKKLLVTTARAGVAVALDPAVKARFLAPNQEKYKDLNNYSAVLKITYGRNSFLLTGDAEDISEHEMLEKGYDLQADLLKVGHHGSYSSSTADFLTAVAPRYAVISVGRGNDYKHPHRSTLKRLRKFGITVYRTDQAGTVIVTSDGNNLKFSAEKTRF